jgi:hypothetical protein
MILGSLSREHETAGEEERHNSQYMLDQTHEWITREGLSLLAEEIRASLDSSGNNGVREARELVDAWREPPRVANVGGNPLRDREGWRAAYEESSDPLFEFPGSLGEMIGPIGRGEFAAFLGPEKRGKCLPATERILMSNGDYISIACLIQSERKDVVSYDEKAGCFVSSEIKQFWNNGIKKVYRVRTKTGREVSVTANHPFLTVDGWVELNKLKKGDFVAAPRSCAFFVSSKMESHEIRLLSYFIAEGCLTAGSPKFTNSESAIQNDFESCIEKMGCRVVWTDIDGDVYNSIENWGKHEKNYVRSFLEKNRLMGKSSLNKTVPKVIPTQLRNPLLEDRRRLSRSRG